MQKERVVRLLDTATVIALFMLVEKMDIPWEQRLSSYWAVHREYFRIAASMLWIIAIWVGMLRPWERAVRISGAAALFGMALTLCLLATPHATGMIVQHYIARLSQAIYGSLMLLTAAVGWLLLLALERANADVPACVEACRHGCRSLAGAFGLLCAGMVITVVKYRQAMWYSVALAGMFMLVYGIVPLLKSACSVYD